MIRQLYRLWPSPAPMLRFVSLQAALAVGQGLLLGCLVPILAALLRPEPDFAAASGWLWAAGIGVAVYWALTVVVTPLGFGASSELGAQLRHRLMRHLTTLPLGWFTAANKGAFVRTVTNEATAISRICVVVGGPVITCVLTPATIAVVTVVVDRPVGLLMLVILPVALLVVRRNRRITAEVVADMEIDAREIAARALEFGQAQPVLRAAGRADASTGHMRDALDGHRRRYAHGLNRLLGPDLLYAGVVLAGFVAVLVVGAQRILTGALPVSTGLALLVLAVRFLEPLGALAGHVGGLGALDTRLASVRRVLDNPALPTRHAHPLRRAADATIEFDDVTYTYGAPGTPPALAGVSMVCPAGTTTAVVGPSGAGKTTLTRLIARFFDVDAGAVRIGGVDVRDYDHSSLLADIAIVFQDVYLFDTTIAENLRLARPDATDDELAAAARAARLDEVIERLPHGWDTVVGEAGAALSGGERQRVSIARALLKQARIVLVDEPASALDPENEHAVAAAITELAADPARTVLVIAHRPATIADADQVVAVEAGRIVEIGAPADLRTTGGAFARIYDQFEEAGSWRIGAATTDLSAPR
ncbi:ABC transporter ATP-binding protein [Nocardia sp. AG03]|uniref:ABC transporter ATP-binding protein n=1 Tax=Nocardia sp. AG03 TaxID=3025312 RepID=UPI002418B373|nr:ABC transporter ATP-binding protein [Nocardia sp. AG03]